MYTVKQVGKMSGVLVRTLHQYHAIGLLAPAHIGDNTYRYYGEEELLRLQQILFYKQFGVSLTEIAVLLDDKNFDTLKALQSHREALKTQLHNTHTLIATIDRTIARIEGHTTMKNEHLYTGFSPEKQSEHEDWLVKNGEKHIRSHIDIAKKHTAAKSTSDRKGDMEVLQKCETEMAACMTAGESVDSAQMQTLLEQHRNWVSAQWGRECSPQAYAGLADMYAAHPDFSARYETIAKGFTDYLCAAMKKYAEAEIV